MAEEFDKSQDATPHKLQEARKKGQVGKSTELPSFFSLLAMIVAMAAALTGIFSMIFSKVSWWLSNAYYLANDPSALSSNLISLSTEIIRGVMPVVLAGVIAAIVANIVHVGPLLSFFPLKADFTKLNPAKGLKKIFSRRSLVELVKLVIKLCFFGAVAYAVFKHFFAYLLNPNHVSIGFILSNWHTAFFTFSFSMLGIFLISAIFDLWYSKKDFARQMKMSMRDVKDENKRQEGDPEIKAKRKKKLAELLNTATSTQNIKNADVIITNPTHVAVALQYRSHSMKFPIVVSKGKGVVAELIKRKARKHGIPIMRKPSLARELLKDNKIGEPIAPEQQVKVAAIYRWVLSLPNNKVNLI